MRRKPFYGLLGAAAAALFATTSLTPTSQAQAPVPAPTQPQQQRPNILVIMGDDVGWFNIGAYHRGIMAGKTPNLDKLASEGMMFTDYYAEASCTAGRAAFITGQLPIRTGLTTVGQAGADVGMPDQAPTIATVVRSMGYTTGQFGKNHLGDQNKFLPCVHGFDEFFGYLYHLDAMEDPFWHSYPQELKDRVGPRNLVHCYASTNDDQTVQPRWGKVGKQRITDEGQLPPHPLQGIKYNMETFDEVIRDSVNGFIDQAKQANKPFFVWMNPTRMHVYTHLSPKYAAMQTPQNSWYTEEAGMAQMDDDIGGVLQHIRQLRDVKLSPLVETYDAQMLSIYGELCGWALARAHAKAGDPWAISGYLGRKSDQFDQAMGTFALAYADQAERDHAALRASVRAGIVEVQLEH